MRGVLFSFLSGLIVMGLSSLPSIGHAIGSDETIIAQQRVGLTDQANRTLMRDRAINRYRENAATRYYDTYGYYGYPTGYSGYYYDNYGYPTSLYDTYGTYNYPYSSYSTYPGYSNPYGYPYNNPYGYPYSNYYYNPGMYNPNTTFVNPPSSLNYPYGYPSYSETYIYR